MIARHIALLAARLFTIASNMCNVISAILFELVGTTIDSLPHSSTVYQCVD